MFRSCGVAWVESTSHEVDRSHQGVVARGRTSSDRCSDVTSGALPMPSDMRGSAYLLSTSISPLCPLLASCRPVGCCECQSRLGVSRQPAMVSVCRPIVQASIALAEAQQSLWISTSTPARRPPVTGKSGICWKATRSWSAWVTASPWPVSACRCRSGVA